MADVKTLYVRLEAITGAFGPKMNAAARDVGGVGDAAGRSAKQLEASHAAAAGLANGLGTVALVAGGALAIGLGMATLAAVHLEAQMQNVGTLSKVVRDDIGGYTQAILTMSTRTNQSASDLAKGLYDIVSSGFDGKDALRLLEAAATSATAGLSDTATTAASLAGILNAYGLSVSQAKDVSDTMFQTVNLGVISFAELAKVTGRFIGTAAAAKVSFGDVASALSAITLSGIGAEEAATSLNSLMQKILSPSDAMAAALNGIGFETGAAALSTIGLKGTIDALAKSQGTAADTAFRLFPEIRAARGYMALTAAEGRNYQRSFDGIADSTARAEATHKALLIQQRSAEYQMKQLGLTASAFATTLGTTLLPVVKFVAGGLQGLVDMLTAMPSGMRGVIAVLGGIAAAVLLIGGGVLKVQGQLGLLRTAMANAAAGGSALPAILRGTAIAAGVVGVALIAATGIYAIYAAGKAKAKAVTDDFVQALKDEAGGVKDAAQQTAIKHLVDSGAINDLKKYGIDVATVIKGITGSAAEWQAAQIALGAAEIPGQVKGPLNQANAVQAYTQADAVVALENRLGALRDGYVSATESADLFATTSEKVAAAQRDPARLLEPMLLLLKKNADGTYNLSQAQQDLNDSFSKIVDPAKAWQDAIDGNRKTLKGFREELAKQVAAQANFASNLAILAASGHVDLAKEFAKMGPEGAQLAALAVKASASELDKLSAVYAKAAAAAGDQWEAGLEVLARIASTKGKATVKALADEFTGGDVEAMVAILQKIKQGVDDIPTKKVIDIVLGTVPTSVSIPVVFRLPGSNKPLPNLGDNTKNVPQVTIRPDPHQAAQASGSVLSFFAGGSERHVAQVAPAGAWRVWAEPETGGEAYIPLSPAKRGRSTRILSDVAASFGYGLTTHAAGSITRSVPATGRAPVVPASTEVTTYAETIQVGTVVAHDYNDFLAQMDRRKRLDSLRGGRG